MTFTSNQYYPVLNWILEKGMYVTPLAPQKLVDDWRENVLAMYDEACEVVSPFFLFPNHNNPVKLVHSTFKKNDKWNFHAE